LENTCTKYANIFFWGYLWLMIPRLSIFEQLLCVSEQQKLFELSSIKRKKISLMQPYQGNYERLGDHGV
jgi:hypothetical protein